MTPEPGTWISLLIGLIGGIAFVVWSRQAKIKRRLQLWFAMPPIFLPYTGGEKGAGGIG